MNYFSENKDLYTTIFTALKNLGVKVPKIKNFKSCMSKQEKNSPSERKMFGISLSKQEWTYDSDYPLPMFLAASTTYLLKFTRTVGLFRKSGSITRQRNLRVKLEKGESLEGSDPNDVASLLKQWLRELSEPLIPHYMHDLFVRCQHLDSAEDRASASLLSCLLLPPEHLHPLKHLLCFLKTFAAHCSENKMGAENLALIIAPNIFISKTESITKTYNSAEEICSNSVIQIHTCVIQLLIENAEHVGEVPQTVSLHYSVLDGRRGSELDSSADVLDFSPSKSSRKLRNGPVHDLFSGIRKLVGQNTNPSSNLKTLTPEKCWSFSKMSYKSAPTSAAYFDQQLPAVKKPVFLNETEKTFSTLNNEDTQALLKNKHRMGSNNVRRKSFGLLRRKDGKRQKSGKAISRSKRNLAISRSSNFNTGIATDRMDSTYEGPTYPNESETKSSIVQFEQDAIKHESLTKSVPGCNLAMATKELFILSTPSSQSCLQDSSGIASSYWLRSDKNVKTAGQLKTQQSEPLHLNAKNNVNQRNTGELDSLAVDELENLDKLVLYSPNHSSVLSDLSYNPRRFSKSKILPTDSSLIDPQIRNFSRIILGELDSYESTPKSVKSNYQRNVNSSIKFDLSQKNLKKDIDNTCKSKKINQNSVNNDPCRSKSNLAFDLSKSSKKKSNETENNLVGKVKIRQEAFSVESKIKDKNTAHQTISMSNNYRNNENHGDLHRSKSFLVDSKWKNDGASKNNLNAKVPKKTSRQSSLIRGKPNTIKSGLPCQHLAKTPNLTQSLELHTSEKVCHQNEKHTTFENSPRIDVSGKEKYFSERDISPILNSGNFNLSSPNANEAPEINCKSSVISKKSTPSKDASRRIAQNDGELPLCSENVLSHSDSKIPRLRHSLGTSRKDVTEISSDCKRKTPKLRSSGSVRSSGHSRIPVLSKQKFNFSNLGQSMNDSCFLTPNQTLFNSPNSVIWMSGNKYLSFDSPQDDSFNKRESIAMILKHNPGHVQAKVHLYNSRVVKSCSNSLTGEGKASPGEQPTRSSSQKQLPDSQKDRKTLSVSQSCDSGSKRISGKSRIKIPLKLPIPPPKFSIDKKTPSPNISHPLKEVTNISFNSDAKQNPITPGKDDNALRKPTTTSQQPVNCCNADLNKKKLKRNSFSGHTPSKFSKRVSRSESSPSCPRPGNRLFKLIQESALNSPNVSAEINNLHDSSFSPTYLLSYQPIKKSGSSLSIQKLRCDEMIDEWECEL